MIISRTPVRTSFLGGGTDFPSWSKIHGGLCIGAAINKYSYITARYLPPFHDFKHRFVYKNTETVNEIEEIKHAAIKAVMMKYGWFNKTGIEVTHVSDLPGYSGTGSSSTFVVGLIKALSSLQGYLMLPHELAQAAIDVEQNILKETVGSQDQVWASYGGLNILKFREDGEIDIQPFDISGEHSSELEKHLMLFFTKQSRISSEIAATYAPTIAQKQKEQFAMMRLANDGIYAIYSKKWENLGWLMDQSWRIKLGMSTAITNPIINDLYATARINGAWGGKITGAGGGGCMLLVAPPEKHEAIANSLSAKGCVHIPFKFDWSGSTVIFSDKSNLKEYR